MLLLENKLWISHLTSDSWQLPLEKDGPKWVQDRCKEIGGKESEGLSGRLKQKTRSSSQSKQKLNRELTISCCSWLLLKSWLKEEFWRNEPGMLVHSCHPNTQKGKAGKLPEVWGLPGLQGEFKASLNCIGRHCLKKARQRKKKKEFWSNIIRKISQTASRENWRGKQ